MAVKIESGGGKSVIYREGIKRCHYSVATSPNTDWFSKFYSLALIPLIQQYSVGKNSADTVTM